MNRVSARIGFVHQVGPGIGDGIDEPESGVVVGVVISTNVDGSAIGDFHADSQRGVVVTGYAGWFHSGVAVTGRDFVAFFVGDTGAETLLAQLHERDIAHDTTIGGAVTVDGEGDKGTIMI
jgi:hypothetical protein